MAMNSNKINIFAGLLTGFALLTTGCASDYISEDVSPVVVPVNTGAGAVGTAIPTPPADPKGGGPV